MINVISLKVTNVCTKHKWKQEGQLFHMSRQGSLMLLDVIWLVLYLPAFW